MEEKNIKKLKKEQKLLESFNIKTKTILNPQIKYGFKVSDTFTFNPIKYLEGLKKEIETKVEIFENTNALSLKKTNNMYYVKTNNQTIKSKIVIISCYYPFFILKTLIPLKTYIKREYVNIIHTDKQKSYNAIKIDKKLHSIRFYKNNLIYTSNQHKLTNNINYNQNYYKSRKDTKKIF